MDQSSRLYPRAWFFGMNCGRHSAKVEGITYGSGQVSLEDMQINNRCEILFPGPESACALMAHEIERECVVDLERAANCDTAPS
jgi:hypothetical protein